MPAEGRKISQLTPASSIADTDVLAKENASGTSTEAVTAAQIAEYAKRKGIQVDNTLSTPEAAADAAKTGEEVAELKNASFTMNSGFRTQIPNGTDYNTLTTIGNYYASGSVSLASMTHIPDGVGNHILCVVNGPVNTTIYQIIHDNYNNTFFRVKLNANSEFSSWKIVVLGNQGLRNLRTVEKNNIQSLADMPKGNYFTATGSQIKTLDSYFANRLNDNITYIVLSYCYSAGDSTKAGVVEVFDSVGTHYIGGISVSGTSVSWTDVSVNQRPFEQAEQNAVEIYSDFDENFGFWLSDGTVDAVVSHRHTQLLSVRPNTIYYFSTASAMLSQYDCWGKFYDAHEHPISMLSSSAISQLSYDTPDKGGSSASYVEIYKFTTPANAWYVSFNISTLAQYRYRSYIASKPIFATSLYGDLIIKGSDPLYQKFKNRKLCVIGTSQIMIDRASRTGKYDGPESSDATQYISGLQEYLIPWWSTVDSYGYSDASMMYKSGETTKSLYTRVVTDQLPIANYDDYFITHSSAGITSSNIGTLNGYSDLGSNTEFIGALRQIIDYIYTLNPKANIFVQARITRSQLNNSTSYTNVTAANEEIRKMAKMLSLTVVDTEQDSGFNYYSAPYWCYDSNGHLNQVGSKEVGLSARKTMLGF